MKTAVVIINYNNPQDTQKCIDSLIKCSENLAVVVVDNASPMGKIGELKQQFPSVVFIENKSNIGFGRANNVGIKWVLENTECKYILILNNDAYVKDDAVSKMQNMLDSDTSYAGCSPRIVYAFDPDIIWYGGGSLDWSLGGSRSWNINKRFDGNLRAVEVTFISGCAMMLRRSIFSEVGGFDPRFFMYSEDVDLCARIVGNGHRFLYIPEAIVYHNAHGSLKSEGGNFTKAMSAHNIKLTFYLENAIANRIYVINKYSRGHEKMLGNLYFIMRWSWKIFYYLSQRRPDAIIAIANGVRKYFRIRKLPFINELEESGS